MKVGVVYNQVCNGIARVTDDVGMRRDRFVAGCDSIDPLKNNTPIRHPDIIRQSPNPHNERAAFS
jgi:hypothetical protein